MIPQSNHTYETQQSDKVESFFCRTDVFTNSFFPYVIDEWNKFKLEISNVESYLKVGNLSLI